MTRLIGVVRRYQVTSFFALTLFMAFGIAVPGLFFLGFDHPTSKITEFCFLQLLLFSPVLSGIIITVVTSPGTREYDRRKRWVIFFLVWIVAFLVSWQTRFRYDNSTVEILNAGIRAAIPALIISLVFAGNVRLSDYLSAIVRPRGSIFWYLVAFLAFPVIHVLGNAITWRLDGSAHPAGDADVPDVIFRTLITFLSVMFFSGGINEETGWRGFALPRLQSRFSPLIACLVIWVFHLIWELPGDVIFSGGPWPMMSRLVWMPSWSILFVWIYNRTNGSILAPMIFHASMNSMNTLSVLLPPTDAGTMMLVGLALFAVVFDKMWKKIPGDDLPNVISSYPPPLVGR